MPKCSECERSTVAKGLCDRHYRTARRRAKGVQPKRLRTAADIRAANRAYGRRWRDTHPGAAVVATRRWLKSHPEYAAVRRASQREHASSDLRFRNKRRLRCAQWRVENPEKYAAGRRRYVSHNADQIRAKDRARRSTIKGRKAHTERCAERKRRKRAGGGRMPSGYIARLFEKQQGQCAACKCELRVNGQHVDHVVPIARGGKHCESNVQLLCPLCNLRKNSKPFAEFLKVLELERAQLVGNFT
jgi:5-methylcytosine-specific restriction endonuclease McrA